MLFNTALFLAFFTVFFILYSFFVRAHRPRLALILLSSLVFYAGWNYRFIPLLLLSGAIDYTVGLRLARTTRAVQRRGRNRSRH